MDRLRQCVDHPLLVMGKGTEDDEQGDSLLEADATDKGSLKDMIASYAGGGDDHDGAAVDPEYALSVLKELEEAETTPDCVICHSEIFDEVLLPCYHRA
jgi:DNA repair protein RAD5